MHKYDSYLSGDFDEDAVIAALDLVGRTGANDLEFGYLHDDVPVEQADWYAYARYRGDRITVEHHVGPVQALEALARRLLAGGICTHCGKRTSLGASARKTCRWTRHGKRWVRGCEKTHP